MLRKHAVESFNARHPTLASSESRRAKLEEDIKVYEMCGGKIESVPPSFLVSEIIAKSRGLKL